MNSSSSPSPGTSWASGCSAGTTPAPASAATTYDQNARGSLSLSVERDPGHRTRPRIPDGPVGGGQGLAPAGAGADHRQRTVGLPPRAARRPADARRRSAALGAGPACSRAGPARARVRRRRLVAHVPSSTALPCRSTLPLARPELTRRPLSGRWSITLPISGVTRQPASCGRLASKDPSEDPGKDEGRSWDSKAFEIHCAARSRPRRSRTSSTSPRRSSRPRPS